MHSLIAWIDHDERERERMRRILALFHERDTRDELGLGAIRDSIADHLFPGTSTIQTRLRYMLFVPWIYQHIEGARLPSSQAAERTRRAEAQLTEALLAGGETRGVLGQQAREGLKRLPSAIYWAGLGEWGIRRFAGSQDAYHHALSSVSTLRGAHLRTDEANPEADQQATTWHPAMPRAPRGFLERTRFTLTSEEADYITDRVVASHPRSLLAFLMRENAAADVAFVWEHPDRARFPADAARIVEEGRRFSVAMFGATLLYNLMLAELVENEERSQQYRLQLQEWAVSLEVSVLRGWALDEFWPIVRHPSHTITWPTMRFVERWLELACASPDALAKDPRARSLIEERERMLKGAQARLHSPAARARWSGASGVQRMSLRWPTVRQFLKDLARVA